MGDVTQRLRPPGALPPFDAAEPAEGTTPRRAPGGGSEPPTTPGDGLDTVDAGGDGERRPGAERAGPLLAPGTRVEVRTRFDGSWTRGFEVEGFDPGHGYRIVRLSDHSTLPGHFDPADVRRRRRQSFWWQ